MSVACNKFMCMEALDRMCSLFVLTLALFLWAGLGAGLQVMEVGSRRFAGSLSSSSRKRSSTWEYSSEAKRPREDEVSLANTVQVSIYSSCPSHLSDNSTRLLRYWCCRRVQQLVKMDGCRIKLSLH